MKKKFQIKEPCNVGWENMEEIPGGSFCDLCSKKVHNLNNKSDEEIQILLDSNESICGRIKVSRLYQPEEIHKINYKFFHFPFRKFASGIFLAAMFSYNMNAQIARDTIREQEIDGMIIYAPKYDDGEDHNYYTPKEIDLQLKFSGNKELLNQSHEISILRLEKRFKVGYASTIRIPEDYLGFKNIFVFENASNKENGINQNQYYTFISKNKFVDNGKTVDFNLDKIKKIEFKPKNSNIIYFLDGVEISKEDFEQKRKDKKIESYFLSEIYARELLGDDYDIEDGIIVSYSEN